MMVNIRWFFTKINRTNYKLMIKLIKVKKKIKYLNQIRLL